MTRFSMKDIGAMVEPDRVHRGLYTDPELFELEMERLFNKVWTYVGHESQVKKPGDYWTVTVGRQPMIMIRSDDGAIHVLYNRCPHRGNLLLGDRHGSIDKSIICSYHAWQFNCDGSPKAIPLAKGYDGTKLDLPGDGLPDQARAARRELSRLRLRQPRRSRTVAARMAGPVAHRVRSDVRPRAGGRGRDRPDLLPHRAAAPTGSSSSRTSSTWRTPR